MNKTLSQVFLSRFGGLEASQTVKNMLYIFLILNLPLWWFLPAVWFSAVLLAEFVYLMIKTEDALPSLTTGAIILQGIALMHINPAIIGHEIISAQTAILMLFTVIPYVMMNEKLITEVFLRIALVSTSVALVAFLMFAFNGGQSAIEDAVTVIGIGIMVARGIREKIVVLPNITKEDVAQSEKNIASNLMSTAIGTTVFGVTFVMAEPYNPLGQEAGDLTFWEFFYLNIPVFIVAFIVAAFTLYIVHKFRLFHYGTPMPTHVWQALKDNLRKEKWSMEHKYDVIVEGIIFLMFIVLLLMNNWGQYNIYVSALIACFTLLLFKGADYVRHEHHDKLDHAEVDETPEKHEYLGEFFKHIASFLFLVMFCLFGMVANLVQHKTFERPVEIVLNEYKGNVPAQATAYAATTGGLTMVSENMFTVKLFITELKRAVVKGLIKSDNPTDLMRKYRLFIAAIIAGATLLSIWLYIGSAPLLFMAMSGFVRSIGLKPKRIIVMCFPFALMLTITIIPTIRYALPQWVEYVHDAGWIEDKELDVEVLRLELEHLDSMSHSDDHDSSEEH